MEREFRRGHVKRRVNDECDNADRNVSRSDAWRTKTNRNAAPGKPMQLQRCVQQATQDCWHVHPGGDPELVGNFTLEFRALPRVPRHRDQLVPVGLRAADGRRLHDTQLAHDLGRALAPHDFAAAAVRAVHDVDAVPAAPTTLAVPTNSRAQRRQVGRR